MSTGASNGGVGADVSSTADRYRDICADPLFQVSEIFGDYEAYLDWLRFATIRVKSDSTSAWDVCFGRNCDTTVGT